MKQAAELQKDTALDVMVRRLANAYHLETIYLFGSRAWGEATADSDYDLMVVVPDPDQSMYKRCQEAYMLLSELDVSKDVVVLTCEEFDSRSGVYASLPATIPREGKLLYAA
ncbi:MAG TPA: nucleotidyltransferase domain-containing protein [Candidatus Hydrogenedentes bacterium]|mgnify:CR=1 FL=1|nr:nucleotidyltransferase domain-containing protein [Candidatus Hydrogenedentota bacterium]